LITSGCSRAIRGRPCCTSKSSAEGGNPEAKTGLAQKAKAAMKRRMISLSYFCVESIEKSYALGDK
jgi:hypothetical protein